MTRWFLLPALLALIFCMAATRQDVAVKALEQGKEKLKALDYDGAIAKFNEAIEARGGNFAEAHQQLGLAYFYSDKLTDAASEFDTAAQQDPSNASVQRYIAEVALFEPDYQKALNAYEAYLDALSPWAPERAAALRRVSKLRMMALGTYEAGLRDADVQFLSRPKPHYPENVKGNPLPAGDVIVEAIFTADGEVFEPRVIKSLGKEFDDDALKLLTGMHFTTAVKGGKPVSQKQKLKMHYQKVFG
ncbi:MAG TPA: energy transducer TonB [Blastocatellia bacterium]|nr:energy transducer TonB [Blastocatellia bacterium]